MVKGEEEKKLKSGMLEIPAVRRIRCSRPASATEWIQDQPELPDTLYKKEKKS